MHQHQQVQQYTKASRQLLDKNLIKVFFLFLNLLFAAEMFLPNDPVCEFLITKSLFQVVPNNTHASIGWNLTYIEPKNFPGGQKFHFESRRDEKSLFLSLSRLPMPGKKSDWWFFILAF